MNEFSVSSLDLAPMARELLHHGCSVRFTARGSSMTPFVLDGDILTIEPCDAVDLRVGDVAFHELPGGSVVAHRVVAISRRAGSVFLATRGDALRGVVDLVDPGSVLGRAVSARRGSRDLKLNGGLRHILARVWLAISPIGQRLMKG